MNAMEDGVITFVIAYLITKPGQRCKSVTVANAIIETFGLDSLKWIKDSYNGLLNMLAGFRNVFIIERIPSNDIIQLIASPQYVAQNYPNAKYFINYSGFSVHSSSCLHVGCLYETTTKQDLMILFSQFARVRNIRVKKSNSRRFAFVEFFTKEDAYRAKVGANRSDLWRGTLQFAKHD